MNVTIHQPHFFPWLGYFNKLANTDIFVVLDDVQFRTQYFQNRTLIKTIQSRSEWITVPISHEKIKPTISNTNIYGSYWKKKVIRNLEVNYCKAPFFNYYINDISKIITQSGISLLKLNIDTISYINSILNIKTKIIFSSDYKTSLEPTTRVIELCKASNCNNLIIGEGNSQYYHDIERIKSNNIKIIKQDFRRNHPVYSQINGVFLKNLSILDLLFNVGSDESENIIKTIWTI
ncbi:WbqC family protein [Psychroserpens algicola]|uniref:WbqC family protein n=1 Tax=Psychroserpens algicola TaxID=1719034 RepID=UPI001952A84D|nr:WbqC family protein [Psychroserpens algicola]